MKRLGLALCALGATSLAQAAVLEEITVTAQKREQSLQDVGISVTAFTGEQLNSLGYTNAQQVTRLAAGVSTVQPNGEANYSIAIRGASSSDFTSNNESPVSVYVDEAYISQMSGAGFMLFDMERVEILRGPQGTLFGRNATGGLAHYITRKPSQEADGYAKITVGEYSQIKLEGAFGGPISDTVSGRISVSTHNNDGYVENRFTGNDLNDADDWAVRGQLLFEPNDNLEILLNVRASGQDIRTGFFEFSSANIPGERTPNQPSITLGYLDNDDDPFAGDYDKEGFNDAETFGTTATIKWAGDRFNITSITDVQSVERDYIEDSDASPVPFFNFFLNTDSDQWSQELRIDGENEQLKWVAGFYYLDIEISDANGGESNIFADAFLDGFGLFDLLTPAEQATAFIEPGTVRGFDSPYTIDTQSWSIFGQIEYELTPQLTGILGFRYIDEEKDYAYQNNVVRFVPGSRFRNGNPNIIATLEAQTNSQSDSLWSARAELDYRPNDDLLLYASWNRGVKAGGFNAPFLPLVDNSASNFFYGPEEMDAFEVGFKWSFADGLARLNGAAYIYNYEDYQAFDLVVLDALTSNRDADMAGFEVELQTSPVDGLDILFGAAYNDADIELDGRESRPVQSPEWNINALVRYQWAMANGKVAIQVDSDYRSEQLFALSGLNSVNQGGYTVTNASLSYATDDEKWLFSLFVDNIFDEEYRVQQFDLTGNLFEGDGVMGLIEEYYGRPQWWGFSATVNF